MHINYFPLHEKCFWTCLNCTPPVVTDPAVAEEILIHTSNPAIDIYSHTTLNTGLLGQMIHLSKQYEHQTAVIYQDHIRDACLQLQPDYLLFPFFSTIKENHNDFTQSRSFDHLVSTINHLPSKQKRLILFFLNKDHFSDCADLGTFSHTFRSRIWIIPYRFFGPADFTKDDILYLKRLNRENQCFVHPNHLNLTTLNYSPVTSCYFSSMIIPAAGVVSNIKHRRFLQKLFK